MGIVHQHIPGYAPNAYQSSKHYPHPTVTEKCYMCDIMHHTQMALFSNVAVIPHYTITDTEYKRQHDYTGIALVLSAGRSPPQV